MSFLDWYLSVVNVPFFRLMLVCVIVAALYIVPTKLIIPTVQADRGNRLYAFETGAKESFWLSVVFGWVAAVIITAAFWIINAIMHFVH